MIDRSFRVVRAALLMVGLGAIPASAQAPGTTIKPQAARHSMELLFSSSVRADGAAEVTLAIAGTNGVEIHQERSAFDRTIISKTILAPVTSGSAMHLSQTRLVLERPVDADSVILVLHPQATPGKTIRLILPCQSKPQTGAVTFGPIDIDPGPGDGGSGGGDCYPISFTSERCGTIGNCCPTRFGVEINGVDCTITCS